MGSRVSILPGLLVTLVAPPLVGQETPSAVGIGDVSRSRIQGGPELWVAERPGEGPVGLTLVLPGGGAGGGEAPAIQALATGLGSRCPEASPVLAAGPDYATLSLSVSAQELTTVLGCLDAALRPTRDGREGGPPATIAVSNEAASPSVDLQAHRTASGVLLATLYAPGPVPGGSLGTAGGSSGRVAPSHLIVVGPVDGRLVERRAAEALGAGRSASDDARDRAAEDTGARQPQPPVATEVLVLERPGESLAEVRVGQLVLPGDHPDWTALVVAREILADRLLGGPWVFAELLRVRGPGAFVAGTRLPVDAVPDALDRLWSELEALRDRLPAEDEVRTATSRLAGSFAVATGAAPALADELARVAALGMGPEAVAGYSRRLAGLTPDAVRRAAREHLNPAGLVIAAAGDGFALTRGLGRFGPVRTVLPPTPPADWPALTVDGRVLRAGVSHYRVRIAGQEVGTARREVARLGETGISFRSLATIGEGRLVQEIEATLPGLDFVRGASVRDGESAGSLRREGGRLRGTGPGGAPVELPLPPGTVVSDLLEPTLWASELEVGRNYRVQVTAPTGQAVEWAGVQVLAREAISVPAGTFETLRVLVTGPEILTLWLERDPPHRTVRLVGGNGVVLELFEDDGAR